MSFLQQRSLHRLDGEPEPEREVTRVPTDADLVSLARELNRLVQRVRLSDLSPAAISHHEMTG